MVKELVASIHDVVAEILISEEDLQHRIRALGAEITRDYKDRNLLLVGVLKGAAVFLIDLARAIDLPLQLDFMATSSYGAATQSSGVVRILKDLDEPIEGRDVLLIDDIVDSGLTLVYTVEMLQTRNPASLKVCTLLNKARPRPVEPPLAYIGFDIPDKFVVGYGMDYAGYYRNLPYIGVMRLPPQLPAIAQGNESKV